jgi:hypothetical protein
MATPRQTAVCMFVLLLNVLGLNLEGQRLVLTPTDHGGHPSPGESILFSIPVNHLSKRWHIEIPYTFALPRGKCCHNLDVGGEPVMVIVYGLEDLPRESLTEIPQK